MADKKVIRFDWAMKHLLRNKANYDIVEGFLCALLEDDNLRVIEILESDGNQDYENDKFNRVDVLVKDEKNRNIIIEIQNTKESDYLYRVLYGVSKNISESIDSGDRYREINKVISVNILYFDLGIGDDYLYYGKTEFHGINTNEIIDKNNKKVEKLIPKGARYNQIEIFPEYYLIQVEKYKNVVGKAIDEWVYWFKNEQIKEGSKSKNINKVQKKLDVLKMTQKERKKYEYYLGRLVSELDMMETSKEEGKKEGKKEGKEEGKKEGEIIGIEKQRKANEKQKINSITKALKTRKLTIEDIAGMFGVSNDYVLKIKKQIKIS
ncbi:MAG: Rpn family recombination-promoting nuclease/putative transposase [Bacteroidota bacterium]|nr:Rpn family recombination-promoting nuclease/putative transposase [Bacteroidota bacterium]